MSQEPVITLGGKEFGVQQIPLGRLKRVLPAVTAVSKAMAAFGENPTEVELTEADYDHAVVAIGEALGLSRPDVESIPATLPEVLDAIGVIAEVAGLAAKGAALGEARPGSTPATDSTQSTESLPTS